MTKYKKSYSERMNEGKREGDKHRKQLERKKNITEGNREGV